MLSILIPPARSRAVVSAPICCTLVSRLPVSQQTVPGLCFPNISVVDNFTFPSASARADRAAGRGSITSPRECRASGLPNSETFVFLVGQQGRA